MARQPGGGRVEPAFLACTVAVTAVAVSAALRLWRADLRVPFVYFYDAVFNATAVKAIVDHGWFLHNPSLGAPAGLDMHDFPLGGENLQFLFIKILGFFSGDWALVMNAYFLLGFVLTSLTAYVVLRQLGTSRWTALVLANVFTLLPYHFVLGETQLFQSAYFVVPLGALLVLDVVGWDVWRGPFLARAEAAGGAPGWCGGRPAPAWPSSWRPPAPTTPPSPWCSSWLPRAWPPLPATAGRSSGPPPWPDCWPPCWSPTTPRRSCTGMTTAAIPVWRTGRRGRATCTRSGSSTCSCPSRLTGPLLWRRPSPRSTISGRCLRCGRPPRRRSAWPARRGWPSPWWRSRRPPGRGAGRSARPAPAWPSSAC